MNLKKLKSNPIRLINLILALLLIATITYFAKAHSSRAHVIPPITQQAK